MSIVVVNNDKTQAWQIHYFTILPFFFSSAGQLQFIAIQMIIQMIFKFC